MNKRFLLSLCGVACLLAGHRAQAQVTVIANPSVKAAEVSAADLRDVFTGAATTLKGSPVTPVLLREGGVHDEFLSRYIGKSDAALRATWRSIVFSGQGSMPKTFDTEAAVVEYVARTPGAIAYVGKAAAHDGVKTLIVR
jgi:ABC-type phosphate transport system substrate-binding protein